ncbi:MAG: hypothetical protein IJS68_01240, partial [Clostridia bacterium]|nr:hypothetical protein [Clostridia bacterium]
YQDLEQTVISNTVYTDYYNDKMALVPEYDGREDESTYSEETRNAIVVAKSEALENALSNEGVKTNLMAKWDEVKDSWLWISNIWVKDGSANPLPTYENLKKLANDASGMFSSNVKDEYVSTVASINETEYNAITGVVHSVQTRWNGYYILAVLAAGVTFLSTYVAELGNKLGKQKKEKVYKNRYIKSYEPETTEQSPTAQAAGSMKIMKFVLPALMVVFVLASSSAFGIYVVTQSAIGILLNYIINLIVKKITKRKEEETIEYLAKVELKKNK